jgi:hypothetical protein
VPSRKEYRAIVYQIFDAKRKTSKCEETLWISDSRPEVLLPNKPPYEQRYPQYHLPRHWAILTSYQRLETGAEKVGTIVARYETVSGGRIHSAH